MAPWLLAGSVVAVHANWSKDLQEKLDMLSRTGVTTHPLQLDLASQTSFSIVLSPFDARIDPRRRRRRRQEFGWLTSTGTSASLASTLRGRSMSTTQSTSLCWPSLVQSRGLCACNRCSLCRHILLLFPGYLRETQFCCSARIVIRVY